MQNLTLKSNLADLKKKIAVANESLINQEFYLFESGTKHCVLTLFNKDHRPNVLIRSINLMSNFDICLVKALLSLVSNRQKLISNVTAAA